MRQNLRYRLLVTCLGLGCLIASLSAQTRLIFTPQWTPQSQFAGYYVAQAKGFYQAEGLEVEIVHPSPSYPALNRLYEGSSDVISLQLVQALTQIDLGYPLVNILQTSAQNSLMIVPRHDDILTPDDLKGKKVGIWRAGFGEVALMADADSAWHIRWIPFLHNINLYISGAIDATLAMTYNEYLQIRASGISPQKVFRLADMGYDIPEDGLYVTRERFLANRQAFEAFARASRKGWEWAAEHPEETLEIVMQEVKKLHVSTNRSHQKWMLEEILRLQLPRQGGKATFRLTPTQVDEASQMMVRHRRLSRQIAYDELCL